MALDPLPTPFASTVLSGQGSLNQSATASSTGDLATANSGAETIAGLNASTAAIAVSGSVVGSALANLNATATSISGSGDADAGDLTNATLYGIDGNGAGTLVSIAGSGSLQGTASATTIARATSVDGNSDASAGINIASGLRAGDIDISGNGTIAGAAQINQAATARSTAGSANADSQLNTLSGISVGTAAPSLRIDGVGSLLGTASLISDATAAITGDSTTDSATASQRIGSAIGLDANGSGAGALGPASTRIGGPGVITGQAEALGTATASATAGSTNASAGVADPAAFASLIGIRPSSGTPLEVEGSGLITATANGTFTAKATTDSGGATANVDGNAIGLGDPLQVGQELLIGGNGAVNASASLNVTAVAAATDGAGNNASASLTPSGGYVVGLSLATNGSSAGVLIEGSGSINALGRLTRDASATTVTGGNAETTISNPAFTSGIDGLLGTTVLRVQGDAGQLTARGKSDAKAMASSVDGNSVAQDSGALTVFGMRATQTTLGGASPTGMLAQAQASQNYQARSVNGTADVIIDNTKVAGADTSSLQANGPSGTAVFTGNLVINANSESTSGPTATSSYQTGTTSFGMFDSSAAFDGSGSLQASSRTDYSARAGNVTGNASAYLAGASEAIHSGTSGSIVSIKGDGAINATASFMGGSAASSVAGNASSGSSSPLDDPMVATGIGASSSLQTITVAGKGDIAASAAIGSEASPFTIQSRSVDANATSLISGNSTGPRATGIVGNDLEVKAGGGSIQAEATGIIQLSATSVNGDSQAQNSGIATGSDLFKFSGVNDANLTAMGAGVNQVTGQSRAVLSATSQSILGTATSRLGAQSTGIASPQTGTPQIKVSGNSSGIAELASTTLSRSVRGIATSTTLNHSVVGIDDYAITGGGNSTLKAQAASNASATATSISGNAISQSIL